MHGCSSTSVILVNAEVDSMGGVVEGGVGVANKTSPRQAAIEKVQAELRQEYDVREKRKRELEFLEKGGDPLDFKHGNAASVSVQSTSFTDQLVNSEYKGSFAFTASPHGDSVESSGRLGANPCEPNSADNLMLFDAEHEFSEGGRNLLHSSRSDIMPSERLSQMHGSNRTWQHGDSAVPRKAYKRRYRSRPNRDGTGSSSTDVNPNRSSHVSSIPACHGPMEAQRLVSDAENQSISPNCKSKPANPTGDALDKIGLMDGQQDIELDIGKAIESSKDRIDGISLGAASDAIASETVLDDQHIQQSTSGAVEAPILMDSDAPKAIQTMEEMSSAVIESQPSATASKVENQSSSCQLNGFSSKKDDGMKNDAHICTVSRGIKGFDSGSSCTQTSQSFDGNNDGGMCTTMRNADSNGEIEDKMLVPESTPVVEGGEFVKEGKETEGIDSSTLLNVESTSACQRERENVPEPQREEELTQSGSAMKTEVDPIDLEGMEACGPTGSESEKKPAGLSGDHLGSHNENSCDGRHQDSIKISIPDLPVGRLLARVSADSVDAQTCSVSDSVLESKIDEDSILKEAQIIEAKRKRIAELAIAVSPKKIRLKTHWDYVLEEMSWLANDFAQERVWKITAAAQISCRVAFACRLRKQEKSSGIEPKKVAHTVAKSVMEFWHSAEERTQRDSALSVKAYALRFLKYNNSDVVHHKAEVPVTPDRDSDLGVLDLSWEDNLTEENFFYAVPPGAMETYRNSIELHASQCERIGSNVQEEEETSAAADFESEDNAYDEDEGETNTYEMPMAFECSKASHAFGQKKRKHLTHAYGVRSYETSSDVLPMQFSENKVVMQQPGLLAKRPGGSLNVSIPTKRVRTASRRVISPFSAGMSGSIQLPNKTDASSGDTNSFQDDQNSPCGGSVFPYGMEVESAGGFEKQLPFDSAEVSTKHKKKKKAKHLNAAYEPRWQVDSTFQNEQFQRDHLKNRHQLEPNGSIGLLGQPMIKKPKTMRQSQDNSFENIASIGGSVSSPVASQLSNMSNPNKVIKMLSGRDRGRKPKVLKMPAGQAGSGSPWTLFEDQALVVLAHDLGPNWELVSDVINSTLQFKCIFRKAKECKERHSFLMDRTSGDGADSAEDSGSSQPYPSTLPGIPKGSARQLFQRLQGPMEEETLKSHFEKIIIIGQKQQYHKNQDAKPIQQPHSSHTFALSQVCPNNLNGGPILTPLDLIDAIIAGPDIPPLGYQGPHVGGLAVPSQGAVTPMHPASNSSSVLPGSPNMMLGNNFSSSPGALNSSGSRDVRFGIPRSASLSTDEQQRMQFNQMISSRNMSQSNISVPGTLPGTDRGGRILAGGNGMGLAASINRSMPMARPGFQGIASSAMVNSGGMVSPGMPSANMHPGVGSGQGSSMLRPREALHMMRPGQSQDSQRQAIASDLQMQVSPGKTQGVSHFGGVSSAFPNQTVSTPVSSYPLHHQPSHPISPQQPQVLSPHHPHFQGPTNHAQSPQQQAYAIRVAKERQQHRFLQQQQPQPQFAASSSLMPHVQSQHQLPIPSPVQNSSQVQSQTASPSVSLSPLTSASSMNSMSQHQQKHQTPTQGVVRNAQAGGSGVTTPTGKQRLRQQQQVSQANRQHPQQRQQPQAQQPSKVAKGVGRGNLMMHQNIPIDSSLVNGVSTNPGNPGSEKGEVATHLMPNQGLYSGSALNAVQPTRQYVSPQSSSQSLPQPKNYSGQAASSTKHLHQMTDNSSQSHAPTAAPTGHQFGSSLAVAGSNRQQGLSPQKLVNQNQSALQRVVQPNRTVNSDQSIKPQARDSDTDQHRTSSSIEMDTMTTLPQATNNATNVVQVSPASAHQWHASEHPNALTSVTNLSSLPSTSPNSSEAASQVGQGLGQRPASSSFPSIRHDVSAQWQQQPSQFQQPNSAVPQPRQHQQHQQEQLLQAGNGNLYSRPGENRME